MLSVAPFSTPGRFWRGNLHAHSTLSDGGMTPEATVAAYRGAGYDFVQLSEHFLERYGWPIADTRRFRANDFTTIVGGELHAMGTSVGDLWHILATGLPLDFPAPRPRETGPELARRARDAGAFVAIAHPGWSQLTIEDGRALDAAHAVEIYNHGAAVELDRGDGAYLFDRLVYEGRRLSAIAVDDSHFNHGGHDAFGGFVEVKAESLDPDALVAALKAGHFYASQGPRLYDVRVGRDEVAIDCSPVNSIALLTGTSNALSRVGRQIVGASFDLAAARREARLDDDAVAWLRVVVIDAGGRRAWTNPIWFDEVG